MAIPFYEAVYRLVREIPEGRLMTYGQVATILGAPRAARAVGYALRMSGRRDDVPWQRVINAKGQISLGGDIHRPDLQRTLLEEEGIVFDENDVCDLKRYRWEPEDPDRYFSPGSEKMPFP